MKKKLLIAAAVAVALIGIYLYQDQLKKEAELVSPVVEEEVQEATEEAELEVEEVEEE